MYFDKDFGPQGDNDERGHAESLYINGQPPPRYPAPDDIKWMRPCEYLGRDVQAKFIVDDASSNEVKQGALGDCWFIGALSVLATRDELLRGGAENIAPNAEQLIDKESA